jgi:hypothetical protein
MGLEHDNGDDTAGKIDSRRIRSTNIPLTAFQSVLIVASNSYRVMVNPRKYPTKNELAL